MRLSWRTRIASMLCGGAAVLVVLGPGFATASIGTGVGASPIVLAHAGHPGHAYSLPGVYVVNTGTVPSIYHVRVERLSPGKESTLPAGWVTIGRNDFRLGAHQATVVPLKLRLPAKASAGSYLSDVVASAMSSRHLGGTALGAAAATKLQLTIAGGAGLPWTRIGSIAAAVVLLAAAAWAVRRSGVRLRLEHS
jgi:hypothetical protein